MELVLHFLAELSMNALNYKDVNLQKNGRPVHKLRVVGVAVEEALKAAQRKGIHNVQAQDLPPAVTFEDVVLNGRKKASVDVLLLHEDAALAVRVAKEVRRQLHARGFGVLKAVEKVVGATQEVEGAHDLVQCKAVAKKHLA